MSRLSQALEATVVALSEHPVSPADLRTAVLAHRDRTRTAAKADPFVDVSRSDQVAAACLALLDQLPSLTQAHHRWVGAACRYYISEEDQDDDFTSIVGFDDDAEVLNFVADKLGLPNLHIPLS